MFSKIEKLLIFLLIVSLITAKLYWLLAGIIVLFFLFRLLNSVFFPCFQRNAVIKSMFLLLFILIISISVRVFLFEIYAISSGSMEDTLFKGDRIFVSKLHYGPALPRSPLEIPWINLIWYFQAKKVSAGTDSVFWKPRRLKGYSKIAHNDVIVFRHPLPGKEHEFFIKRCTGLPGDTLQIVNGVVLVNGNPIKIPKLAKQKYRLKIRDWGKYHKQTDSLQLNRTTIYLNRRMNYADMVLTYTQKSRLQEFSPGDPIQTLTVPNDTLQWVYPKQKSFSWTIDNYGPLVIPKKGMTIKLTNQNFPIYQRTLEMLEKIQIQKFNGLFSVNKHLALEYTFQHDYYFMMGDKRWDSNDSRYWGFVPEENVTGKSILVLFSRSEEGFIRERLMKIIK